MSQFLRERHYNLAAVGVRYKVLKNLAPSPEFDPPLRSIIEEFMLESGLSVTNEDIDNIEAHYRKKYCKHDPCSRYGNNGA